MTAGLPHRALAAHAGFSAAMLLMLAGCGGGGDGSAQTGSATGVAVATATPTALRSIQGRVLDGPIAGAKVCLDTNRDGACGTGETSVLTGADGSYTLTVPDGIVLADHVVVAEVGPDARDSDDQGASLAAAGRQPFVLMAPADADVITPYTTLAFHTGGLGAGYRTAAETLAARLGVPTATLLSDYVAGSGAPGTALLVAAARGLTDGIGQALAAHGAAWGQSADARAQVLGVLGGGALSLEKAATVTAQAVTPPSLPCTSASYWHLPVSISVAPSAALYTVGSSFRVNFSGGNGSAIDPAQFTVTVSSSALQIATITTSYAVMLAASEASAVTITVADRRCPTVKASATVKVVTVPSTTGVSGVTSWAGQPSDAPPSASNVTKGFLVADYMPIRSNGGSTGEATRMSTWTITGRNLGSSGSLRFSNPALFARSIVSWTATAIVVVVGTNDAGFTYDNNVSVTVTRSDGVTTAPVVVPKGVAGMIATRSYGQCTWEVARQRVKAGLSVPDPTAYSGPGITAAWVPAKWDGIAFGTSARGHVGVIVSVPVVSEAKVGTTWVRTYTFDLTDRNANWDEALATVSRTFKVTLDRQGGTPTGIYATVTRNFAATAYWR
jgi:hypothetical protein